MEKDTTIRDLIFCIIIASFGVLIILSPLLIFKVISANKQAEIYNKMNGTNYSASDMFFGQEQINTDTRTLKVRKE